MRLLCLSLDEFIIEKEYTMLLPLLSKNFHAFHQASIYVVTKMIVAAVTHKKLHHGGVSVTAIAFVKVFGYRIYNNV